MSGKVVVSTRMTSAGAAIRIAKACSPSNSARRFTFTPSAFIPLISSSHDGFDLALRLIKGIGGARLSNEARLDGSCDGLADRRPLRDTWPPIHVRIVAQTRHRRIEESAADAVDHLAKLIAHQRRDSVDAETLI